MRLNHFGIRKLSILSTLLLFVIWFIANDIESGAFINYAFTASGFFSIALMLTVIYFIFKTIFYVFIIKDFIVVRVYLGNILGALIFSVSLSFSLFYFLAMNSHGGDRMEGYAVFMLSFMLMLFLFTVSAIYFATLTHKPNFNIIKNLKHQLIFAFVVSFLIFSFAMFTRTSYEALLAFLCSFLIVILPAGLASLTWYFTVKPPLIAKLEIAICQTK